METNKFTCRLNKDICDWI